MDANICHLADMTVSLNSLTVGHFRRVVILRCISPGSRETVIFVAVTLSQVPLGESRRFVFDRDVTFDGLVSRENGGKSHYDVIGIPADFLGNPLL